MTFSITTLSIMTLSITIRYNVTLSIKALSIMKFNSYPKCYYAVSFMLSVAIQFIMLSVVLLNVVMLNGVAPCRLLSIT
jgi:hypothetical protein